MANKILISDVYKKFWSGCFGYNEHFDGVFSIFVDSGEGLKPMRFVYASKIMEEMQNLEFGEAEYFITKARSSKGWARSEKKIYGLNNICAQVDDKDASTKIDSAIGTINLELFVPALQEALNAAGLPEVDFVAPTGKGFQLWWGCEPCAAENWAYQIATKDLFAVVDDVLFRPEFSRFKLNRKRSDKYSGLVRVPGTYNSKAKMTGTLIDCREGQPCGQFNIIQYAHKKIDDEKASRPVHDNSDFRFVKQYKIEDKARKAGKRIENAIKPDRYVHSGEVRLGKLTALIDLRAQGGLNTGLEHDTLLIASAFIRTIGMDKFTEDDVYTRLWELNGHFEMPMSEEDVRSIAHICVTDHAYRYKDKTIIERLGITEEEQEATGIGIKKQPDGYNRYGMQKTPEEHRAMQAEYNERMCDVPTGDPKVDCGFFFARQTTPR